MKKGKPFFHLVAADSRARRDGKFIEKLGTYNPNTNPATIEMNFDRTLHWVQVGAEMSDTARAILSYKGILYKNHLVNGVKKGALTMEDVETRFSAWEAEKNSKIDAKKAGLGQSVEAIKAERFKVEAAANAAKKAAAEAKAAEEDFMYKITCPISLEVMSGKSIAVSVPLAYSLPSRSFCLPPSDPVDDVLGHT